MQTEEQAAKEISYYLIYLAGKQRKKVGDCFTLDTVFESDRYLSLERRKATCSRAVDILNTEYSFFEWSWRTNHSDQSVVVSVKFKEVDPPDQDEMQ